MPLSGLLILRSTAKAESIDWTSAAWWMKVPLTFMTMPSWMTFPLRAYDDSKVHQLQKGD